jgi:signal peptidase I
MESARACGAERKPGQPCPRPTARQDSENFIKRLVAGPGDRIRIIHGQAIVNGRVDPEANRAAENDRVRADCGEPLPPSRWDQVRPDGQCNFPVPIVVPPEHYFMMGDNRGNSTDSRYWGPIPREWIIGKAFATYWPPDRLGIF